MSDRPDVPTSPQRFRKKPVVIQASQWFTHGDHPNVRAFVGVDSAVGRCGACGKTLEQHGHIDTLEGSDHTVCPGDWIIRGVKGEFHPIKPDIFTATYEPAEDQPDTREPRIKTILDATPEDAELMDIGECIYRLRQRIAQKPYINAVFDAGYLAAAQSLVEGGIDEDYAPFIALQKQRDDGKLLAALQPAGVPSQITDPEEAAGIIRGLEDAKAGRVQSLDDIDRELCDLARAIFGDISEAPQAERSILCYVDEPDDPPCEECEELIAVIAKRLRDWRERQVQRETIGIQPAGVPAHDPEEVTRPHSNQNDRPSTRRREAEHAEAHPPETPTTLAERVGATGTAAEVASGPDAAQLQQLHLDALRALTCLYITVDEHVADDVKAKVTAALDAQAAALRTAREQLVEQRVLGHSEGQEHAIADANAGLIDDLIAPRLESLKAELRTAQQERDAMQRRAEAAESDWQACEAALIALRADHDKYRAEVVSLTAQLAKMEPYA